LNFTENYLYFFDKSLLGYILFLCVLELVWKSSLYASKGSGLFSFFLFIFGYFMVRDWGEEGEKEYEACNMQGQCVYEAAVLSDGYLAVEKQSSHTAVYIKLRIRATCQWVFTQHKTSLSGFTRLQYKTYIAFTRFQQNTTQH